MDLNIITVCLDEWSPGLTILTIVQDGKFSRKYCFLFISFYAIVFFHRHQRFYSLLDRFRATVSDTSSPSTPVTSHPLDGDPPPAPELVTADKVKD